MEYYFILALWVGTFFYALFIILQYLGISKLKKGTNKTKLAVSIIIAARNEEKTIEDCLSSALNQNYPEELYEVIVINDRSTDKTGEIITKLKNQYTNLKTGTIDKIDNTMPAKKNALRNGINMSSGEILMFIDADCVVSKHWISSIIKYYNPEIGAVVGFSGFSRQKSFLSQLISLEQRAMEYLNASFIGLGSLLSAAGRNLSYRKIVYENVGGFDKISQSVSGDDDLFLHLIKKESDMRITYSIDSQSFVKSIGPESFSDFSKQRKRHISASKYYPIGILVISAFIYLYYLSITIGFVASFIGIISIGNPLIILIVKIIIEFLAMVHCSTIFKDYTGLFYFPLLSILFIPYILIYSILGLVNQTDWKG